MDEVILHQLAKRLNLTDSDIEPDPYILTQDEEEKIIQSEIDGLKKYWRWKLGTMQYGESEMELKISQTDFKGMIDRDQVLSRYNMVKHQNIWHKKRREEEKDEVEKKSIELSKTWTAKFAYAFMAWTSENVYREKLIVNEHNKKLISALCFFISRDQRFAEMGYDFNKGLLIRGKCGIGKTYLVKCLEKNELRPILIQSMIEITDEIKLSGEYEIKIGNNKIIYLDDVGTEETTIKHYGTNNIFFKEFIEKSYFKSKTFSHLIISTNINFKQIEEKYGFRVASRMKDMFNVIDVFGEDMRVRKNET